MGRLQKTSPTMDGEFDTFFQPASADEDGRLVYLTGNVSENLISIVQQQILRLASRSKEPIHLVVSTYGGSVHEMFSLYDLIKFVPCPIYTVGLGKVMSAGSLIMASGAKGKRMIGASTTVMIHSLSAGVAGNLFEMANEVDELKRMHNAYIARMTKETKMTAKDVEKMLSSKLDGYLTAQQAVKFGIADKIFGEVV